MDPDLIERRVGKLGDMKTDIFLPAPFCYVTFPKILTQKDCEQINE